MRSRFITTADLPRLVERLPIASGRARMIMRAPFDHSSPTHFAHGRSWILHAWKIVDHDSILEAEWVDEKALRAACRLPIRVKLRIKLALAIARSRSALHRVRICKQQQRQDRLLDAALGRSA